MTSVDSTRRFSSRVADYVRWRPGYPDELIDALASRVRLSSRSIVADVGAGTGISSAALLRAGCFVTAVEPNDAMRAAADAQLGREPGYRSVAGTAEATTLGDASVNLVTAGQAFHWFDPARARAEFTRILRPRGWIALFWNTRRTAGSPFMEAYARLLDDYGTDYHSTRHEQLSAEALEAFFGGPYEASVFDNEQTFDFDGLKGRLVSSSYVPSPDHPRYEPMLNDLRRVFDTYQRDGVVTFPYDAELYLAPV